uniref:Uncharacterized protein n=1 Tax=Anopheles funestus TaxID=62324 RepID=A0A4Y0AX86_ANOFN
MGTVGWICVIGLLVLSVGSAEEVDHDLGSGIKPSMVLTSRAVFDVPILCPDGAELDHKGICRRKMG